jgi:hypothetical protein
MLLYIGGTRSIPDTFPTVASFSVVEITGLPGQGYSRVTASRTGAHAGRRPELA